MPNSHCQHQCNETISSCQWCESI